MDPFVLIVIVVAAALLFDFANGWNDSANAIATVVSTRVLSPFKAVLLAGVLNFIGALLWTNVAKTIGGGLVEPGMVTQTVVLAAMLSAFVWVAVMTLAGLPISGSHSLIGAIVGTALFSHGWDVVQMGGLKKVFWALLISPIAGLVLGFAIMAIIMHIFKRTPASMVNRLFGKLQLVSVSFMALSHGTNDAQKVMGVITIALFSGGYIATIDVPLWVKIACAVTMGVGTMAGGWRVIKTMGMKLSKIQPVHGFAAETAASIVLIGAAHLGAPVSTTHTITSSIMGVGATKRLSAVKWGIGMKIIYAWIFTLPACGILGGVIYYILKGFVGE